MSILEHVNERIECTRCVAADVVKTCVEGLGVRSLPFRHILGNLERFFEGGNLSPAGLTVRHVVTSLALVVTILLPRVALASTLVGSYNIPTDADNVACDWFGYDYNTMDSGLRALLHSSTTTGGAGTDANPNFAGYAAFRNSLYSPTVAGDYQWYSRYDGFMFVDAADKARADIEGAIRWWDEYGSEQGGGGESGGGAIGSTTVLQGLFGYYPDGRLASPAVVGATATCTLDSSLLAMLDENKSYMILIYRDQWTSYGQMVGILIEADSQSDFNITYSETSNNGTQAYYSLGVSGNNLKRTNLDVRNIVANGANLSMTLGPKSSSWTNGGYTNSSLHLCAYANMTSTGGGSGGGSGGGPTGGPVPPETPTTPEVDEQPTYNNIYNINGSLNIDNSTTGNTEFDLDLSELLDILKTINNNLVSFAEDFHNMWDWWAEEMGVIESDIRKFQDVITTWLQMIYNKISSGASSQPNPVTEPTSWWDWLLGLLNGVIGDLPTQLSAITTAASALRNVFPFSIPWDLGVLLGLFVATPVTPVMDIPLGISASRLTYVHVDCSSWNGVMQTVRSIELVAFAAGLAFKTRELLKVVEV